MVLPSPLEIIEAHLTWMRAGAFAANTVRDATRLLLKMHEELPNGLIHAAREELTNAFDRRDWSAQTKATYRAHVRRFFVWATDEDDPWLSFDPTTRLRAPKVNRGIPRPAPDAAARIAVTQLELPFLLHTRLAAYAGLRDIEVARLRREDMDVREIRVFGKGDKPAMLPMHRLIWDIVEDMPSGPITRMRNGRPANQHWVSEQTNRALRRAGANTTMHRLRAWYITWIQRTYKDATVTQRLARHSSLNTTQGYVLVADEAVQAAVAGLPDLTCQ